MAAGTAMGFAAAVLAPAGVHTLYGHSLPGLPVRRAEDSVSGVLARAHRAVRHRPAGAVHADGTIELPGGTGAEPREEIVSDRTDPLAIATAIRVGLRQGGVILRLDIEPDAPWPQGPPGTGAEDPWLAGDPAVGIDPARRIVVLAGPGVAAAGAVPGLHALAGVLGAGVLNTWGAKGIYHWRSRRHWATIGLQVDDFRLAGIDGAELVVASGVDDREAPPDAWTHRPHVVVEPEHLAPAAEQLVAAGSRGARSDGGMPALRARLAAATQAGWDRAGPTLAPSRVTFHYGSRLASGGLVAADAGMAGFWVARTLATTELGMVAVPPEIDPGWAAACVAVARLADPLRPALAVLDQEPDAATSLVVDFARSHGIEVGIEAWLPGGDPLDAEAHQGRLDRLVVAGGGGIATISTNEAQLDEFVAAAGPLRPWKPRPPRAT